ncbi:uracil-DNA glycosylase [Oleidesulfovibrio sp.]|uniref:uracil-DNA glycosylase n=1 Tax=Oleidesulfovibrio sp. TaxID=2909707 RepID=UPI003A838B30
MRRIKTTHNAALSDAPPADWLQAVPLLREGAHLPLLKAVAAMRSKVTVYPPAGQVFAALHRTPLANVHVVIVGQDPYHGAGQAHGLAFSVPQGVKPPPSLRNVLKEAAACNGTEAGMASADTDLTRWAEQGVLLLNTALTVEAAKAGSHASLGWHAVTDDIIRTVSEQCEGVVFMLWGNHARQKAELVDIKRHLLLESVHPSPFSAHKGFLGCGHFYKANEWLKKRGVPPVRW